MNNSKPLEDMVLDAAVIVLNRDTGAFAEDVYREIVKPTFDALGKEVLSGKEWP